MSLSLCQEHDLQEMLTGQKVLGLGLGPNSELAILFTADENWGDMRREWAAWRDRGRMLPPRERRRRQNGLVPLLRPANVWLEGSGLFEMVLPMTAHGVQPLSREGFLVLKYDSHESTAILLDTQGNELRQLVLGGVGVASVQVTSEETIWVSYNEQTGYGDGWEHLVQLDFHGELLFSYSEEMMNCDWLNVTKTGVWFSQNNFSDSPDKLVNISLDGSVSQWENPPRIRAILSHKSEPLFLLHSGELQVGRIVGGVLKYESWGVLSFRKQPGIPVRLRGDSPLVARNNRMCLLHDGIVHSIRYLGS